MDSYSFTIIGVPLDIVAMVTPEGNIKIADHIIDVQSTSLSYALTRANMP